jgi:hypothetical protein
MDEHTKPVPEEERVVQHSYQRKKRVCVGVRACLSALTEDADLVESVEIT